ncbi:hypothetical protein [Nitrosopumilus sp. b3]|uniref:hypothetical protein n=1 Tax=Nitrosopumilus sp. b3 TaxID=2109909 RepID=UPI0015F5701B|nr:hypothetical protein [Nitrosopumilus sp. b3]
MMTDPPRSSSGEEICPMCKREKSKHTNKEMLACSRKLQDLDKNPTGGAGID